MSSTDGKWEYETLRPPRGATKKEAIDPKAQLNELGEGGWELVTTVEYVGGGTKYMVFKRPADTGDVGDSDTDAGSDADTSSDGDASNDTGDDGEHEFEGEGTTATEGNRGDQ